jgi:hypothetical protein
VFEAHRTRTRPDQRSGLQEGKRRSVLRPRAGPKVSVLPWKKKKWGVKLPNCSLPSTVYDCSRSTTRCSRCYYYYLFLTLTCLVSPGPSSDMGHVRTIWNNLCRHYHLFPKKL